MSEYFISESRDYRIYLGMKREKKKKNFIINIFQLERED
jgi:hypothetical protein